MANTTGGEEQAERMLQGAGEDVTSVHSQQHQRRYLQTHPISWLRRRIRRPRRTGMQEENCDIRGIENLYKFQINLQFYDTRDRHGNRCWWVIIARGSGGALNLLCSLLALTMCREANEAYSNQIRSN